MKLRIFVICGHHIQGTPALQLPIKLRPALLPGLKVVLVHLPALVPGLKVLLVHLPAPAPGGKIIGLGKAWLSRPFSSLQTAQCSSLTLLTNSSCSPLARPLPGTLIIREHRSNLSQWWYWCHLTLFGTTLYLDWYFDIQLGFSSNFLTILKILQIPCCLRRSGHN